MPLLDCLNLAHSLRYIAKTNKTSTSRCKKAQMHTIEVLQRTSVPGKFLKAKL